MTQTKIRAGFSHDLRQLEEDILSLGSMVNTAIKEAIKALQERDERLAMQVIMNDEGLNKKRFAIEDSCISLIAKQQPVARDLRTIVAAMTIVLNLERMGDHAAGIAKIAIEMAHDTPIPLPAELPRMVETCRDMLSQSLNAFVAEDRQWAENIIAMDNMVDNMYKAIFRQLVTEMISDSKTVTRAMYLLFVSHNLERIGDRVTNICERIEFRATGQMEEVTSSPTAISLDG